MENSVAYVKESRISTSEKRAIDAAKRASTLQLLFKCARLLDRCAIERLRRRSGLENLRPAHTALLPHIDLEGTRLTELAAAVGISKQAVAQLVDELVEMGALTRVPDPVDGRAKLIRFARSRGRLSLFDGLAVLAELEAELAAKVGQSDIAALHRILTTLLADLETSP